jgi:hypothetical protein
VVVICSAVTIHVSVTRAQNPEAYQSNSKPSVFRFTYVAGGSLYIDTPRNANRAHVLSAKKRLLF